MKCTLLILVIVTLSWPAGVLLADVPDQILFPHDLHFEAEVECATCHDGVAGSTSAADHLFPEMDVCADCHDVDADDECSMCHTNADEAGEYTRPAYGAGRFAHAPHLARDMACATCHGEPTAVQPRLPGKADCRTCHETADNYADCRLCHAGSQQLRPLDHGPGWQNGHGLLALQDLASCYQCHTENTCQECHTGDNVRPRSHRLNYAFDHALEARGQEMQCATCHEDPSYCSNCHVAERVLPQNHSQAGWVGSTGGRHATEGLFNLESCIACHDAGAAEPSCALCHTGD